MSTAKKVLTAGTVVKMSKEGHEDVHEAADALTFAELQCGIKGFQLSGQVADEIDVTAICDKAKKFVKGLVDSGEMTFDSFYSPDYEGYDELVKAAADDVSGTRLFVFEFVDGSAIKVTGFVKSEAINGDLGGLIGSNFIIRLSGELIRGKKEDILGKL